MAGGSEPPENSGSLMENTGVAEAPNGPGVADNADDWKRLGGEAYKAKEWQEAIRCYSAALDLVKEGGDMFVACANNRAACYVQLRNHLAAIKDASDVLKHQPANIKALMRRMVAYDETGKREEALADAAGVLTMEPKNAHALQIVDKKRASLTAKPYKPPSRAVEILCVFLFSEDRPLHCYACLRKLLSHVKECVLNVHVFWQASDPAITHSYQLLQTLHETSRAPHGGKITWCETSHQQLFPAFSRTINRMSVEGLQHVLLLSDTALFHTDLNATVALQVLEARNEAFTVRLDVNPRIDSFPEAELISSSPPMQLFAGDPDMVLWTRSYDKSKQAFEKVARESGWDAILPWTGTIIRVEHVQHFFSALLPPINNAKELDEKAADWLSRRQRMKRSELSHRSACYKHPILVTLDPDAFGDAKATDALLRGHLRRQFSGDSGLGRLARELGWKMEEVTKYFDGVEEAPKPEILEGILEPERYRGHYFTSVRVPVYPPTCGLPAEPVPSRPLVSWLVPVRNAESFILDCLESLEAQTGLPPNSYEVVLVNDNSEDASLKIMKGFAETRPHIRIIDNALQMGVAGSLCEGWPQCKGDFVARIDADDIAEPDRIVKQLRYMEQFPTISVVGGRTREFWTETRVCTVEKVAEKDDGRMVAVVWREDHGNQTSRKREQITLQQKKHEVLMVDGPAEYFGCRIMRIGDECLTLNPDGWRKALKAVQGKKGDVVMQRRDPPEPPRGSPAMHPLLVRATLLFEDCISGTTAMIRKSTFSSECPFPREEAETHWGWLNLGPKTHAANIGDALVMTRRHEANRGRNEELSRDIYESKQAAVQYHLTKTFGVEVDMHDAAALLNFRGPRTNHQGEKMMAVLQKVEHEYLSEFVRPKAAEAHDEFWRTFVEGQEMGVERAIRSLRLRYQALVDKEKETIQSVPEHSPRERRSRTPPR